MSNNFRRTAVLKKISIVNQSFTPKDSSEKKNEGVHALKDLKPHLSVRKSRENYGQICGKSKASLWRNLSTGTPPFFWGTILCFVALVSKAYFFSEQPSYGNIGQ